MRSTSSIILASALAFGVIAKPLDKRVMVTEIDLEIVTTTVYVTAGYPAETSVSKEEIATPPAYQTPTSKAPAPAPISSKIPPKPSFPSAPGYSAAPAPSSSKPAPKPSSSSPVYVPAPAPSTSSAVYVPPPAPSTSSVYVPAPKPSTSSPAPAPKPSSAPVYGVDHITGEAQADLHEGADYQNAMLWHHNRARANHGASNLEWSDDCAAAASNAAAFCDFEHHTVDGQGQNLFTVSGDAYNATAGITESWYKSEADVYGAFGAAPNMATFHEWGHLTQVLWKNTTHVGCVTINCGSKMTIDGQPSELSLYTVCNYSPPGNYEGEYAANVAPPAGSYAGYSWMD
ncbi:PR-1-like protein [Bimuria novae-zelandiae CBS 107.79]|uniref:PR-1-like protein n=1 Tax=Bimuria novae-zelandiae CBS 107.79 TaxID=1447943 RepID=A0A6A5UVB7_9PLEO|nr:PR-1-like protein [Bimuria novae-zelandiae CBS 107.79]